MGSYETGIVIHADRTARRGDVPAAIQQLRDAQAKYEARAELHEQQGDRDMVSMLREHARMFGAHADRCERLLQPPANTA